MLVYLASYAVAFLVFAGLDIVWLTTMGAVLYRQTLGDILLPTVRMGPAIAFYLLYPVGLVVFGVAPALKAGSVTPAITYGALFGLLSYATYDLTNFATLRNWTLQITLIDIVYGAFLGAVVSAVAFYAAPTVARWFGGA
jgi:uncharacterized membrane protein